MNPDKISRLLHFDEQGRWIGLEEVQLQGPFGKTRTDSLIGLLGHSDNFIVSEAARILTAWGIREGLERLEGMIDHRIDKQAVIEPHRIYGVDNIFDEFAWAIELWHREHAVSQDSLRIVGKLLDLYGECYFRSHLKGLLLAYNYRGLLPRIEAAVTRAKKLGKIYLASQLIPVLARYSSNGVWAEIKEFLSCEPQTPHPLCNVAEAMGYLDSDESLQLLQELLQHPDATVSQEAKEALERRQAPTSL